MSTVNEDHFQWIDDLVRRWPVIIFLLGLLGWATNMQFAVNANAKELRDISKNWPEVVQKLNTLDSKFDAVIQAMGYEVKYVAVKKSSVNVPSNE